MGVRRFQVGPWGWWTKIVEKRNLHFILSSSASLLSVALVPSCRWQWWGLDVSKREQKLGELLLCVTLLKPFPEVSYTFFLPWGTPCGCRLVWAEPREWTCPCRVVILQKRDCHKIGLSARAPCVPLPHSPLLLSSGMPVWAFAVLLYPWLENNHIVKF